MVGPAAERSVAAKPTAAVRTATLAEAMPCEAAATAALSDMRSPNARTVLLSQSNPSTSTLGALAVRSVSHTSTATVLTPMRSQKTVRHSLAGGPSLASPSFPTRPGVAM